jgi:lysozyme
MRMKLNRGQFEGAADEFPKWRKAGGRIIKGLVRRRKQERELFLT